MSTSPLKANTVSSANRFTSKPASTRSNSRHHLLATANGGLRPQSVKTALPPQYRPHLPASQNPKLAPVGSTARFLRHTAAVFPRHRRQVCKSNLCRFAMFSPLNSVCSYPKHMPTQKKRPVNFYRPLVLFYFMVGRQTLKSCLGFDAFIGFAICSMPKYTLWRSLSHRCLHPDR